MNTTKPQSTLAANGTPARVLQRQSRQIGQFLLESHILEAVEQRRASYPILRHLRIAARVEQQALFDDLALSLGWQAHRIHGELMLLESDGLFVSVYGTRKGEYCSASFHLWAESIERAESAIAAIEARVGEARIAEPMFSVDWHFVSSCGDLESASIEEIADSPLIDAAYPELSDGVAPFIARYLAAPETVLVLQGPPGTGKTRLIRAVLSEISRRAGGEAEVLYTGDKKALENEEIFVKFITGTHGAFVVEDADHLLTPRAEGNQHLHRFLAIADGVVRAQSRKIIFSTNLPNLGDLDDALIRPGRCFARVHVRELSLAEAERVIAAIAPDDADRQAALQEAVQALEQRSVSLATIYKLLRQAEQGAVCASQAR
ncbi:MAG: AAA family ATPase [Betaproteobacteria bacterium]|nr:AAA family ATPase [Betaproteobacteria bacterium]